MWQRNRGKFHLLLHFSADVADGRFLQSACGDQIQVRRNNQEAFVFNSEKQCPICAGIWHICFTSVFDAKTTVQQEKRLKVLNRALELAHQSTLKKVINSRINKLLRDGSHANSK